MEGTVSEGTVGLKRGSVALLAGSDLSPTSNMSSVAVTAKGSDSKKFKEDHTGVAPSRVLHLRNLPGDVTDAEVTALGLPFGTVTNVLLLKGMSQAFLELATEEAAVRMVSYCSAEPPRLRNQLVYIQYSTHKELRKASPRAPALLGAAPRAPAPVTWVTHAPTPVGGLAVGAAVAPAARTSVLRILIDNMYYPVTLDVLHQIFSQFGAVVKIVTFTRNNQFQALLQFSDPANAQPAKLALDGQNIYNDGCTMKVDFSSLVSLHVKYNDDKSRDYTRPDLPSGDDRQPTFGPAIAGAAFAPQTSLLGDWNESRGKVSSGDPSARDQANPAAPGTLSPLALPHTVVAAAGHVGTPGVSAGGSSVVLVSKLNEEKVTLQSLFTLFGVYGDVQRVKILYNKKDSALIQMADGNQSKIAVKHLNGQVMHGHTIRVTLSKHRVVQLPREGLDDPSLTKDFCNSPLHRFKKPGSKNFRNIFPPSEILHLSNIPPSVAEKDLRTLFANTGGTVKAFKFFKNDHKMALLQLATVEEAIQALIDLHNYDLGDKHHLRVSFSNAMM